MSTDYKPIEAILMAELFDGRLASHGITEVIVEGEKSPTRRCLTDGRNVLWVYGDETVDGISRYGRNATGKILGAIEYIFDVDIFSEYAPQYWGFESQEEWDLVLEKIEEENENELYEELINFLSGEPNTIKQGTIGIPLCQDRCRLSLRLFV
jgi:hypothetical protein